METSAKKGKRTPKRKSFAENEGYVVPKKVIANSNGSKIRRCQKATCPSKSLKCFAEAAVNCARTGNTSRWYHMSDFEHFCNDCFDYFYRTHKEGYKRYEPWRAHWSSNCRKEGSLKLFFAEEIVPFWVQCNKCDKWRELENNKIVVNKKFCETFVCSNVDGLDCDTAEDEVTKQVKNYKWILSITCLPYLKDSPACPFLKDFYYDGIGLSPPNNPSEEPKQKFTENMIPFYSPEDSEKARCICADVMTGEEREEFPHHIKDASIYLGLRNLVMAMWSINPKQYLTYRACLNNMICRGLARITLAEELKKILDFLTINGYVNFGILPRVPKPFNLDYWKGSVVVIGAGIAGVGAARQLHNAGCKVTILESSDCCGGRIRDDNTLGSCIGLGAQIITGCINNPLYVMCEQVSLPLRYLGMRCDLVDNHGYLVDSPVDQEVEFRFNLMLDSLEDWKQSIDKGKHELFSLSEALAEQQKELQKSLCKEMSEEENCLLQFHLGNLEYGCGSSLQYVSAVHWNQNEEFPQYSGAHAWAIDGFEKIVHEMIDGLDVKYSSQVVSVDSSGKKVVVKTKCGETYKADKVISALPLSIFQSRSIKFNPPIPTEKQKACDRLGAGLIEKIALKFKTPFWRSKIGEADYFGHVPESVKDRGLFSVFYDVSKGENYILMTVIAGEAVKVKAEMTDEQLVDKCIETLKKIFKPEGELKPVSYVISNWASEPSTKMAYSFVKVGSSGKDCDILATNMDEKIYFAGEATNRQFPQTVTGAYLSGLREAKNILRSGT